MLTGNEYIMGPRWVVVLLIRQTARPPTARLGCIPGTTIYRNIRRFPNAQEIPGNHSIENMLLLIVSLSSLMVIWNI
jgi:hypothetical protein